ncbi:MAG: hypothetical protein RMK18_03605 [Armatimonadota bacterium]|nr:hypothetical protein [Armatimonadota bacterium]MDW8024934.1 hypothetical protein [Armatimonadota bacterium]
MDAMRWCFISLKVWRWYYIAMVCAISVFLAANHFSSRTMRSLREDKLDNQAVFPGRDNQRCCGSQWKVYTVRKLSDAELYKAWVYPVREEHERKLPFLKPVEVYGNPKARICVRAFYPFHRGHEHYKDYFKSLARQHYPHLRVECVNFGTPTGFKLFRKEGLSCGTVMLQGYPQPKARFGDIELPIVFEGPMDEAWQKNDLETLVGQLINHD